MSRRALVLFSGGQDSATCLAWALAQGRGVPEGLAEVDVAALGAGRFS